MARTPHQRLASYERRYRQLAAQLADIGMISPWNPHAPLHPLHLARLQVPRRPPEPHGPYWQWTRKIDGKTVTRRLNTTEAKLYREWIANDRRLRAIIDQMRTIATKAADIHLTQTPAPKV